MRVLWLVPDPQVARPEDPQCAASGSAEPAGPWGIHLRRVSCVDELGTGIEAFQLLIPAGWQFEGGVQWTMKNPNMPAEKFAPQVRALFGKHVDCSGGWHDAGDTSKFAFQEYNSAYQMLRLYERGRTFVMRAGTIILAITVVIWALAYFPRSPQIAARYQAERETVEQAAASVGTTPAVGISPVERLAALERDLEWLMGIRMTS